MLTKSSKIPTNIRLNTKDNKLQVFERSILKL